jgi:rhodanese-related sulfurtransferase
MSANERILISGTLSVSEEETFMNEYLSKYVENQKTIVLYGRNSCDDSPRKKRAQLLSLGISDVYVYAGGMFEWVLLQDIYGENEFPTSEVVVDIIAYRPLTIMER